jgi:transposase
MTQIGDIQARISEVDNELNEKMKSYAHLVDELKTIPGIDHILAVGIIAEATADMSSFADERKFAAWAGVASGNNVSAGKKRSKCRRGNPSLRKILIQAAHGAKMKRSSTQKSWRGYQASQSSNDRFRNQKSDR